MVGFYCLGELMAKAKGRRTGSKYRGYFYWDGRGWFTKFAGRFVALEFENGDRMGDRNTSVAELKAAVQRATDAASKPVTADDGPGTQADASTEVRAFAGEVTVEDVCSCRHTYAKSVLQGYWSGKVTNIAWRSSPVAGRS
jgi:hypothetical protein